MSLEQLSGWGPLLDCAGDFARVLEEQSARGKAWAQNETCHFYRHAFEIVKGVANSPRVKTRSSDLTPREHALRIAKLIVNNECPLAEPK